MKPKTNVSSNKQMTNIQSYNKGRKEALEDVQKRIDKFAERYYDINIYDNRIRLELLTEIYADLNLMEDIKITGLDGD